MNPITKLCSIRASREDDQKVWAAIAMVRSIGNCPVTFSLLDISGALEQLQNHFIVEMLLFVEVAKYVEDNFVK